MHWTQWQNQNPPSTFMSLNKNAPWYITSEHVERRNPSIEPEHSETFEVTFRFLLCLSWPESSQTWSMQYSGDSISPQRIRPVKQLANDSFWVIQAHCHRGKLWDIQKTNYAGKEFIFGSNLCRLLKLACIINHAEVNGILCATTSKTF